MKFSRNHIILGILGAAAAGVVVGMIVAPSKGSKLRSDLKHSANDITNKLGDLLNKGRAKYDQLSRMANDEANHVKKNARRFANDTSEAYNDYTDKVVDASDDLLNDVTKSFKKARS